MGAKRLTIQLAVEELDLYELYKDIIDSYGEDLQDPSLVSDLYDLIDEYEEEYEFYPDAEGDYSASFERNLKDAITTIVEDAENLSFVDDEFEDEQIPEIYDDDFEPDSDEFDIDLEEEDDDSYDY